MIDILSITLAFSFEIQYTIISYIRQCSSFLKIKITHAPERMGFLSQLYRRFAVRDERNAIDVLMVEIACDPIACVFYPTLYITSCRHF